MTNKLAIKVLKNIISGLNDSCRNIRDSSAIDHDEQDRICIKMVDQMEAIDLGIIAIKNMESICRSVK